MKTQFCWKCYQITPHTVENGIVTCGKCGTRVREEDRIPMRSKGGKQMDTLSKFTDNDLIEELKKRHLVREQNNTLEKKTCPDCGGEMVKICLFDEGGKLDCWHCSKCHKALPL